MIYTKKTAILCILDILKEDSDENHPLTQKDIINKLKTKYQLEIERKTIGSTIETLTEYGFDIVQNSRGGYYLKDREFNENEIKYLIDALYSSKSISGKRAKEISQKLYKTLSKYQQKDYSYLYKSTEINRLENIDLFLNIEKINEAIKSKKKISFEYLSYNDEGKLVKRRDGYRYKVSPYFLINNFNKYYLLCNIDWFDNHANYRIEYMTNIKILDEDIKPYKEVSTLGEKFDITKHINDHIYMFGGKVIFAKVEILNANAITYVIDWFGNNARIYKDDEKLYATIKSDDKAFFFWALQYQEHIKIISPQEVVDKMISTLKDSLERYKI